VDPSSHFTNRAGVFDGPAWEWETENFARDSEVLDAVRCFVDQAAPTATYRRPITASQA